MSIEAIWYQQHPLRFLLLPFSWLFCLIACTRRWLYQTGKLKRYRAPVPVIVVGNISVGGTGKTPLVIWLSQFLQQHGYQPAIVSRGYGAKIKSPPVFVTVDSTAEQVGDEPLLIATHTGCPVAIAPKRAQAIQAVLAKNPQCDCIICDDGLQHYAIERDIEIAVIDGVRGYGNQHCLPAGPLREPVTRLQWVDFMVVNGTVPHADAFSMHYHSDAVHPFDATIKACSLRSFTGQQVHAVAGIGHPEKFFTLLREKGLKPICHPFPDHHHYQANDIQFADNLPVIMTEKDAVKCESFALSQHWFLPIRAQLDPSLGHEILEQLAQVS